MSQSNQETVKAPQEYCGCNEYGVCGHCSPEYKRPTLSPLARAALANGVSFEDVQAYCEACETRPDLFALLSVSLGAGVDALAEEQLNSDFLDAALARSVLAEGTIEHARLWWRGVL